MKKILLALAVLAGLALPSIAQIKTNPVDGDSTLYMDTEYERDRDNKVNYAVASALDDFKKNGDLNSPVMDLIPFFLGGEQSDSMWRLIHDSTVKEIINTTINMHDTSFFELLIDQNIPTSEISRYVYFANMKMEELNKIFEKLSSPSDGELVESFSIQEYETCETILELLEQAKKAKIYEQMERVDKSIEKILWENNEKKMKQYEQEYKQRYNY